MDIRDVHLRLTSSTMLQLRLLWKRAYERGDRRLVRRTSALLVFGQGQAIATIAADLSVSIETLYAWLRAFLVDGVESLAYRHHPGRPAKLTKTQKRRLTDLLDAGPLAYGLTPGCWTSLLIQQVILNEFGVLYNRHYLCTLLHNLGYSYQKARFVSDHLDPVARQQWLEQTWPQILQQAQQQEALLLFVDEAGFPQWGTLSYTWALRGQQPEVQTSGKRKAYKVFGAVDALSGRLFYQGIDGRFTSQTYQQFLTMVLAQTTQPLILIHDGARYHTSKAMQTFFKAHRERLSVERLPSYSPDFNPIEHLWQVVREDTTHNKYFAQFQAVIDSVETTLQVLQQHPKRVRQALGDYATAEEIMPKAA